MGRLAVACLLLVLILVLALAGCIDALEPDTGAALAGRCVDEDSDTGTSVSFVTDIAPVFAERCAACHFPDGIAPIGLQVTGLDLSSHASVIAGARTGAVVVADKPCASVLFLKVSPGPPFGGRMPLNGPPFLTDGQIQLIHDWIAEGALAE
jgi:mono/diheme cytochrome c family protein